MQGVASFSWKGTAACSFHTGTEDGEEPGHHCSLHVAYLTHKRDTAKQALALVHLDICLTPKTVFMSAEVGEAWLHRKQQAGLRQRLLQLRINAVLMKLIVRLQRQWTDVIPYLELRTSS